jgi:hypothetical protein
MTVREMVKALQVEVRNGDLTPGRASEILNELAALFGNCKDAIRKADADYATVYASALVTEGKANRARIVAETTQEFQDRQEARDTLALVEQLIGALKYFLRSAEAEMRLR